MSAPRFLLAGLLGATTLATSAFMSARSAQAQVFFHTWNERFSIPLYEPAPRYRIERDRRLHPSIIIDELEDRGFRDLVVVARRADVYVIEGVSPRTGAVRLVVDAYDGEIIQRDAIRRSDARIVGEDRNSGISAGNVAALPTPPVRRLPAPDATAPKPVPPKVAGPLPEPTVTAPARPAAPAPSAPALPTSRPPSADWNPINSVPVAPLL